MTHHAAEAVKAPAFKSGQPLRGSPSIRLGRELTISEVSEFLGITAHAARCYERAGEEMIPQSLQIMVDQRERVLSQIHELELALTTTDLKIATYAGAAGDDTTPKLAPAPAPPSTTGSTAYHTESQGEPS